MKYTEFLSDATPFLDSIINQLEQNSLNIEGFEIDHLCWRSSTNEKYENLIKKLEENNIAKVIDTAMIAGRPISTVIFNEPIKYKT